jgi:hypothetical protein
MRNNLIRKIGCGFVATSFLALNGCSSRPTPVEESKYFITEPSRIIVINPYVGKDDSKEIMIPGDVDPHMGTEQDIQLRPYK